MESSNIEDRFLNISSFHPRVWEKVDQQTQIYFKPQERGTRFHYLLCMRAERIHSRHMIVAMASLSECSLLVLMIVAMARPLYFSLSQVW